MAEPIVIFGMGGYARVVADAAVASGDFSVSAFLAPEVKPGASMLGFPAWPESEVLVDRLGPRRGIVAVGDNFRRETIVAHIRALRPDFEFVTVVHPRASISRFATVGEGSAVLAGAIVCAAAWVGAHVSLYTNTIVEHDDVIGDCVTLAPAAALGGTVRVGARSFLGMAATAVHGVSIGADTVVGANATVTGDLPACVVAVGTPARVLRSRTPDEPYLS